MLQIAAILIATIISQTSQPAVPAKSRVPAILERAILQRTAFKTAVISYRRESIYPRRARTVENNEVRLTESEEYVVEQGDDEGILGHGSDGGPAFGVRNACLPRETLFDHLAQKTWRHWNSYETFDLRSIDSTTDHLDLRTVGILCYEKMNATPKDILNELAARKDLKFSEAPSGDDLVRVTASSMETTRIGRKEMEWVIDSKKGPSITKVAMWYQKQGEPRTMETECRTTLAQFDGRWWPKMVEIVFPEGTGGIRYDFKVIEFDRPTHPTTLDTDFMGIPAGAIVYNVIVSPLQPVQHCYLGQGQTVPRTDWIGMKDQFDSQPLRDFQARMQALGLGYFPKWWDAESGEFGLEGVSDQPDLWEAYVRRWVMRNTTNMQWVVIEPLTDAQKAAARGVLSDCRKKAVPIRTRCDAEAIPLRSELAALAIKLKESANSKNGTSRPAIELPAASQPANSQEDVVKAQIEAVRLRISELERPKEIASIFEELKTRLDAILTTKQRDPANGAFEKPVAKAVKRPDGLFEYVTSTERQSTRKP